MRLAYLFILTICSSRPALSHEDNSINLDNHQHKTVSGRCISDDNSSSCSGKALQNTPFQIISSDVTTADGLECCMYPESFTVGAFVRSGPCEGSTSTTLWTMDEEGKIQSTEPTGLCMTRVRERVKLTTCEDNKKQQMWVYSYFDQNILWRYSTTLLMSTDTDVLANNGKRTKLAIKDGTALGQAWKLQFEAEIITSKTEYASGESIDGTFINPEPDSNAWIAIYPASLEPLVLPLGSTMWDWYRDLSSGSFSFSSTSDHDGESWPLCDGEWRVFLINGDTVAPYESIANSNKFTVSGGDCSYTGPCAPGTSDPSALTHKVPVDGDDVRNVAFASCYKPDTQISTALWDHVRSDFGADVWSWLGDNTYSDGTDMEYKRVKYNEGKENTIYSTAGPIAGPKIAVTGTWDDHDYGANNMGKYYQCRQSSQNEFALFFDLPESDPRHPSQGDAQRKGVYNSYMFSKPDGGNGIHLIHIDARYYRSPSFSYIGTCEGADSTVLGDTQWDWLQDELNRESEVKIIGSGIQVLPPTYRGRSIDSYCSYDYEGGSFDSANAAIGEDSNLDSSGYEMWSEYPQERTKLLKLAQKSINDGNAKKIVFISGDQHWGEISAKKMPNDPTYGSSQTLYEVTASGIDQRFTENIPNAHRIRNRSADYKGNGDFTKECNFPFIYGNIGYNDCTTADAPRPWCSIKTVGPNNYHQAGYWGYCLEEVEEVVPRNSISFSNENTCTDNYLHVCSAQANYGGIEVDWEEQKLVLSVFTPHEAEPIAASVSVDL